MKKVLRILIHIISCVFRSVLCHCRRTKKRCVKIKTQESRKEVTYDK